MAGRGHISFSQIATSAPISVRKYASRLNRADVSHFRSHIRRRILRRWH